MVPAAHFLSGDIFGAEHGFLLGGDFKSSWQKVVCYGPELQSPELGQDPRESCTGGRLGWQGD